MDYTNQDSIVVTIKKMLGIDYDYTVFDADIIAFINSALMSLTQLGVGPEAGFVVKDYSQTWHEFLTNKTKLEAAKQYIYLKTRLAFDPPASSVITSYEKQIAEIEWRLNVQAESVQKFSFVDSDDSDPYWLDERDD